MCCLSLLKSNTESHSGTFIFNSSWDYSFESVCVKLGALEVWDFARYLLQICSGLVRMDGGMTVISYSIS